MYIQSRGGEPRPDRVGERCFRAIAVTSMCTTTTACWRDRSIYAHCIHLDGADRARMTAAGATPSFCPTSNLFIGGGLYDLQQALSGGQRGERGH